MTEENELPNDRLDMITRIIKKDDEKALELHSQYKWPGTIEHYPSLRDYWKDRLNPNYH